MARWLLWLLIALGLAAPVLAQESLGTVADFTLTERSGRTVHLADLRGKVWIADLIFTTCPGPCPLMSHEMAQLQKSLPRRVQLVSFSVDPEHDTPAVLSAYAKQYGADPDRWWFLTGDPTTIQNLARNSFKQAVEPGQGGVVHGTHFVLVDGDGNLRGFYDSSDAAAMARLRHDVMALVGRFQDTRIPALNACLNAFSGIMVLCGFWFIRQKRIAAHRYCMTMAFVSSTLFLISYLAYHYRHGVHHFVGTGMVRPFYFALLGSHTLLAVLIVPLILVTFFRALSARFDLHRAIARWTLPLWLYVSVTGVLVYFMLYQWYP
ncbi:MAG: DUF420 domain-containing protein [Candidatus Xenobia bacterium]